MGQPQPEQKQSLWELLSVRLGVLSAAIGLVVALVGLPRQVSDAFKDDGEQLSEQERLEIAAAAPRLDVSYAILTAELLARVESREAGGAPAAVSTLGSFPEVENEVSVAYRASARLPTRGCRLRGYGLTSVTFLVIQNRGGRAVTGIDVTVDRLALKRRIIVREAAVDGDDYVAKIRQGAQDEATRTFKVPWTLEPGDGIRVPLFVSTVDPQNAPHRWCVVSPVAFQPRSLRFVDAVLHEPATLAVRRMRDPVRLWTGAWARG